jgi:hypothetical protein
MQPIVDFTCYNLTVTVHVYFQTLDKLQKVDPETNVKGHHFPT